MVEGGRAIQGFMRQTAFAKCLAEPIRCIVMSGEHGEGPEGKGKALNPPRVK